MNVLTKQQNFELWRSGAFGNKLRQWRTVDEWQKSGFGGRVVLRYLGSAGGGLCEYNLAACQVWPTVVRWTKAGAKESKITVNEAAPDYAVVLQGEYWTGGDPWNWMLYSRVRAHMRPALARESHVAQGLTTDLILRGAMSASSWADFEVLRDQYPNHAIEYSVYEINLGDVPSRNTLVWEVRQY